VVLHNITAFQVVYSLLSNIVRSIALYVGKNTSVTFKSLVYKDLALVELAKDEIGKRFHIQRLTPYYYNWSAVAADFNKDGKIDIASGPWGTKKPVK
jgi:hypothetical protein